MSRPRSIDTRNKILEVAEKEFATYGYAGAHLQSIAEQVGVQKTALYYYFPSKSALFNAVLQSMLETLNGTIQRGIAADGNGEERLEALLGELNDLLAERPNYSKLLFRMFVDRSPFDFENAQPLVQEIIRSVMSFYRDGIDRGDFRRMSSRHFVMSMIGTVFFHYASGVFGAAVLDVDDIFTSRAVAWRRQELKELIGYGVLTETNRRESDAND